MSNLFDIIFSKAGQESTSLTELITINAQKAALSDMAIEKAVNMIAKAIAKSEFVVIKNHERVKNDIYWMLNIRPNPNETATEFWIEVVKKLLIKQECVIIHSKGELYRCSSFSVDSAVNKSKTYTNIQIESKGDSVSLRKNFKAEDVIHLKNPNKKIQDFLKKNIELYNAIASGLISSKKLTSIPKFELDTGSASTPILRSKDAEGKEITLTIDQYKEKIKSMLESENIEIITNRNELKLSQMKYESGSNSEEIVKFAKEIYTESAYAFDIPKAVFLGEITEKADSTNEFITYAVSWLVELLNDAMNAALVGKDDYIQKGEKIWIDMSCYKHRDIIDSAAGLDKLRAIGFTFDEILELVGREALETDFSKERVITKNYTNDLGGEGSTEP